MTNMVTLNPPSIDFTVDGSGFYAVKHWFPLELAALRFDGFPADAKIVRAWLSNEQMAEFPTNAYGDISCGVYGPLYAALSGVPARERCQPVDLTYLTRVRFVPGADITHDRDFLYPIAYSPGSRIGFFPQVNNVPGRAFSVFSGFNAWSDIGFAPLSGVVYHDLPNKSASGQGAYSFRNTLSEIPSGGTQVRVTVAGLADGVNLQHMSVGVRDGASGFNMKANPVSLFFDGGPTVAPFSYKRSAWAPLSTQAGDALLLHSCVSGAWVYKDVSTADGNPGCYVAGTSGYDAKNFSGTVQIINGTHHRKHVVAMVEVQ